MTISATCPRCGSALEDLSRPCPSCGAVVSSQSQMPTVAAGESPDPAHSGPVGRLATPVAGRAMAFTPGEVLAGRYRIIGLLGRGGMGDVYRADDLELGQPVSLKFLPPSLERTPGALERFRGEVRNARQISHPNVCRVYDIGEIGGLHFLTMEFVDGEDLATLLRRIGRLPAAKANEVASQLCAGVAAAHDKGVLHRDLKPSNVMLDGDGHVRITDFGLAVRAGEGAGDFAGTPAYMAPEQFEGAPVTVRSDLYALGLILYEVYTGRRPFEATSVAEWKSRHTQSAPTPPSGRDEPLDEAVERAILRCLEKDPAKRPASARQLAASLPGGDPVAAALAAGETPSPEMIAASGGEGALAPRAAWALAAGIGVVIAAIVALAPLSTDFGLARMTMSQEVLRDRATQTLARFGYTDATDRESWFERLYDPMIYVSRHTSSVEWQKKWALGPPVVLVYRQSPRWMIHLGPDGRLTRDDPPFEAPGMATVVMSADGHLRFLRAVPPRLDSLATHPPFAWSTLFDAAKIDTAAFQRVAPTVVPLEPYDDRAEWTGTIPDLPGVPLRIAAAAYGGRPVDFEILGPWEHLATPGPATQSLTQRIAGGAIGTLGLISMIGAVFLVRRNRRLERGDTKGATRIAGFLLVAGVTLWLLTGHHVPSMVEELQAMPVAFGSSLLTAALGALLYLAVEPYVRRRMPELMIGWARLLEGRLRDPRVGRDVLIGAVFGAASAMIIHVSNALPRWVPIVGQTPVPSNLRMLESGAHTVAALVLLSETALLRGLTFFFILFLLRLVVRSERWAMIAAMALFTLVSLGGENVALETPFAIFLGVTMGLVCGRFGLLTAVSLVVFLEFLAGLPLPFESSAPYALSTVLVLAVVVAIAGYALRISIGSRPLFSGGGLDE